MTNQHLNVQLRKIDKKINDIDDKIKVLNKEKNDLLNERKHFETCLLSSNIIETIDFEDKKFTWDARVKNLLYETFKLKEFRPLQLKTINATLSIRDCILIKPTGGGKSLCYQLPSLISGFSLVISPLVSLMYDQIMMAERFGIKCASLDSSCSLKSQNDIYKCMESDSVDKISFKLIFVTPEKISKSKKLKKALEKAFIDKRIARFVIDEIHCCSQWGHDFRPDYNYLHILKSQFPDVPILGLTATASDNVIADIKEILCLNYDLLVFRDNYNRPNLYYEVKCLTNEDSESKEVCNTIKTRFPNQSGIVYCFSQKDCEKINNDLQSCGIKSSYYHANLVYEDKKLIHQQWLSEECKVIVATIAFGMGIDKGNVRFVIHACMSKSLENYYQESGRAGRDGNNADCILIWKLSDYFKLGSNLFQERRGIANLNIMCQYVIDVEKCKRIHMAKMFQGKYSTDDCKKMCCICNGSKNVAKIDIREIYVASISVINKVEASKNPKITGNKMVNDLMDQMKTFKTQLIKDNPRIDVCTTFDKALCHLIIEGYLKLDFHFGSFKNFAYVMHGERELKDKDVVLLNVKIPDDAGTKTEHSDKQQLMPTKRKNISVNHESVQSNKLSKR